MNARFSRRRYQSCVRGKDIDYSSESINTLLEIHPLEQCDVQKNVPCNYIFRTYIVSLLLIDLCHIHTETKVVGVVSLLKPTLSLIEIYPF